MSEPQKVSLTNTNKKYLVFGALAAVGIAAVALMTAQTEPKPVQPKVSATSLTGGADMREVTLEGIGDRLAKLEQSASTDVISTNQTNLKIQKQLDTIQEELKKAQRVNQELQTQIALSEKHYTDPEKLAVKQDRTVIDAALQSAQQEAEAYRKQLEQMQEQQAAREASRQQSIYEPGDALPDLSPGVTTQVAPSIRVFSAPVNEEPQRELKKIKVPAGSILQAYLVTGVDAPTGTKASSAPVPVLMRIQHEAIMPNNAYGDIAGCHLLAAAYGELSSERVLMRGETVSCVLNDGSAVEGAVKFFVAGEDGKNGVKGRLVTRAGRMIAAAAGAAITDGLIGALDDGSNAVGLDGLAGTLTASTEGASKGLEQITEYYIDLAEETFPVIEVTNQRWVDVVLTAGLEIEWKGQ